MAAIDLTSLDAARAFLQLQTTETELDDVLAATITRCSRELAAEFEREFAPAVSNTTRVLQFFPHGLGGPLLVSLSPWDLRAATTIVVDDGLATEHTLTAAQWEPCWHDRRTNTYLGIELRDVLPDAPRRRRTLTITGAWGLEDVPEDLEQGCLLYVKTIMRADVQAFGASALRDGEDARTPFPVGIPNRVLGLLRHYRRFGVG